MSRSKHRLDTGRKQKSGRVLAWTSAVVLTVGSIGLAVPALAAQPDNPSAHGQAQSQAHSQSATHHATKKGHTPSRAHTSGRPAASGSSSSSQSGSSVSLDKPNGFQAQSDPDGMENGGVDQPGGTGGVDLTDQDGNNGSGNDADCEDDNRGVGVPGHCKPRPETGAPETPEVPTTGDELPPTQPDVPGDVVPDTGDSAGQLLVPGLTTTLVSAPATGTDTALASAPHPRTGQATASSDAQAGPVGTVASVLPNTGAGQALLGLALAALVALGVGTGLVRRGRRTARITV